MISSLQKQLDVLNLGGGFGLNVLASGIRMKQFHCTAGWGSSVVKQFNDWAAPLGGKLKIQDIKINICSSASSQAYYLIHVFYRIDETQVGRGSVIQMTHFYSSADWGRGMEEKSNKWLESMEGSQV